MPLRDTPRPTLLRFAMFVCVCGLAIPANAQRAPSTPAPESKTLKTKDGVSLSVTYFASTAGRDAAPVILVHDLKGSGRDFTRLARRLQQPQEGDTHESFAVVTLDLRGHGDSRKQAYRGRERELDAARLSVEDMRAMVLGDMEAVRKFLVTENDAGKLNLNRVSLVGTGLGALVATNFAANDWAAPKLASVKQGQDVKAIVMISPEWKVNGLEMTRALRQPGVQREVAVMMHYGQEDRDAKRNASRIYSQLDRYHSDATESEAGTFLRDNSTMPSLASLGYKTKLQGGQLLKQAGPRVDAMIADFLTQQAAAGAFPYSVRRPD